ncbi:hypothetical protein TCAL_06943 [Tigriopus californicus]|uniref:RING-type E3 ubiquitin transferase n=1 Tax=Tigriopus californicus TaxID=6832 RepID=A0A553NVG2_TIGCA|nr:E3 ubiquitin-protein ligase ZNF598-like [Tigriopus californicus]TRY69412.1 hypothetical protein TCAL_06943 [Tigriopus californicus]
MAPKNPPRGSRGPGRGRGGRGGGGKGGGPLPPPLSTPLARERFVSESGEDACPICLNTMVIFATGRCNHPVCSECSTRIRVLCEKFECPICRQDMPKVIHSHKRERYEDLHDNPTFKLLRKHRIGFEDEAIERSFQDLLTHQCQVCGPELAPFRSFSQLEQHVRREHQLFYCDLCVQHLNMFSHERKFYNRSDLATHRRKGDPDDKSHKGHPECVYCSTRFLDKDSLFMHVRRDHFFCHFCDSDGRQCYFGEYADLRIHFRDEHFLCEECDGANERFTNAFRTELDLKGHIVEKHRSGLSKNEVRQNRTVGLEFNYGSHRDQQRQDGRGHRGGEGGGGGQSRRGGGGEGRYHRDRDPSPPEYVDQIDSGVRDVTPQSLPDFSGENFPTLGGGATAGAQGGARGAEANTASRFAKSSGRNVDWRRNQDPAKEDFPSLPGASTNGGPASFSKPLGAYRKAPQAVQGARTGKRVEDFPALGGPSKNLSQFKPPPVAVSSQVYRNTIQQPAWSAGSGSNKENQTNGPGKKPAPPPDLSEQFPGLGAPLVRAPLVRPTSAESVNGTKSKKGKNNTNKKNSKIVQDKVPSSSLKSVAEMLSSSPSMNSNHRLDDTEKGWNEVPVSQSKKSEPKSVNMDFPVTTSNIPGLSYDMEVKVKPEPTVKVIPKVPSIPKEDFPTLGPSASKLDSRFRPNSAPVMNYSVHKQTISPQREVTKPRITINNIQDESAFPSLGPTARPISANFRTSQKVKQTNSSSSWGAPSQAKAPPPGLERKVGNGPPPGFAGSRSFKYEQPQGFKERNNQLLAMISKVLGGKSLEFKEFKDMSIQYRTGKLDSKKYYNQCVALVSLDKFLQFFPELIALLPEINMQQELLKIHQEANPQSELTLTACQICQQVLRLTDLESHETTHALDSDFPALG